MGQKIVDMLRGGSEPSEGGDRSGGTGELGGAPGD